MQLKDIREFFWPILDPLPENIPPPRTADTSQIMDVNLETALSLVKDISSGEDERRKTVESKASLLLSTISVGSSIVVAAGAWVTGAQVINCIIRIEIFGGFVLALYAAMTVWHSINALRKGNYHQLSFSDINIAGDENAYRRHLIKIIQENTFRNIAAIDEKVDCMHMAQLFYKRSIIVICLYALMVFGFSFVEKKQPPQGKGNMIYAPTTICKPPMPLVKDTITKPHVAKLKMDSAR